MISRYEHTQIKSVFSQENRIKLFLDIERKVSLCHNSKVNPHFDKVDLSLLKRASDYGNASIPSTTSDNPKIPVTLITIAVISK